MVFKALGHPTRLAVIEILATEGGKCVCELVERLGFDQSTVSKHLGVLRSVGILRCTKKGLKVTYEINTKCVYQFMKCVERIESGNDVEQACGPLCTAAACFEPQDRSNRT